MKEVFFEILNNNYYTLILSFLLSLVISHLSFPPLIFLAKKFDLYDIPNNRKLHKRRVPILGGIGFFFAWIITILFFVNFNKFNGFQFFLTAVLIIISLGVKDDLSGLNPLKKILGQVIAALIVAVLADYRITSFYGIFGIYTLPYFISVIFTVFVFLIVVNGFNLIDGIDGLAVSIGIIGSVLFGMWFFNVNEANQYFIAAISLTGALVPFLKINMSPAKMFMGDTGSMFIGFILAFLAIVFIERHNLECQVFRIQSSPILAMAIIFLPIYDVTRSFFVRLAKGKNPFKPDKNHVHHLLLRSGMSHLQATVVLVIFSLSVFFLTLVLTKNKVGYLVTLSIILSYSIILNFILFTVVRRKESNEA